MNAKPIKDGKYFERDEQGNKRLFTEAEAKAHIEAMCNARSNSNPRVVSIFSTGSVWRFRISSPAAA